MALVALQSAASGMSAMETQMDVISNNLANVNTTGFKAERVNFEDLLYQHKSQPGVQNAEGDKTPAGIDVGLGTRVSNTQHDFSQGSPLKTNNPLDLYIEGKGFFQVTIPNSGGNTTIGYTRAGNFFENSQGDMVLGNSQGPRIEPPITIPQDTVKLQIAQDGTVNAFEAGKTQPTPIGQIQLATFVNPAGLQAQGQNIYTETAGSGPPIQGNPGQGTLGTLQQNTLESSNVDPVTELVALIKAQRAFEMNSQSIKAADQAMQVVGNLHP